MATLLSYALTTLADVKESMGIASSDLSWDNLIIRKINQVTKQIESYCGRRFKETTYTDEEYNATQTNQIILKQRPVTTTVTPSFSVRDTSLNEADWDIVETNLYFVDTASGVIDGIFRNIGSWNRYRVTYSAGYATIPEDLAEAAATLVAYYVSHPDGSIAYTQRMGEGQRMIMYHNTAKSFRTLLQELGLDDIIDSYANLPIMTDR